MTAPTKCSAGCTLSGDVSASAIDHAERALAGRVSATAAEHLARAKRMHEQGFHVSACIAAGRAEDAARRSVTP